MVKMIADVSVNWEFMKEQHKLEGIHLYHKTTAFTQMVGLQQY